MEAASLNIYLIQKLIKFPISLQTVQIIYKISFFQQKNQYKWKS